MQTTTKTIPTTDAPRLIAALRSLGLRVAAQRDGATTELIFLADDAAEAIAAINQSNADAWKYAVAQQGYDGDYAAWCDMPASERQEYECGAAGMGTV